MNEEMKALEAFVRGNRRALHEVEDREIALTVLFRLLEDLSPRDMVERIRHSKDADYLLASIGRNWYFGTSEWKEFVRALIDLPSELIESGWSGVHPTCPFTHKTLRLLLSGSPLPGQIVLGEKPAMRQDPYHILWQVLDADAYWRWVIEFRIGQKDFRRAYEELRKAYQGVRVPSPTQEEVRSMLRTWQGYFYLEASLELVVSLTHDLYKAMFPEEWMSTDLSAERVGDSPSNSPGYRFANDLTKVDGDCHSHLECETAGVMVLKIARHIADLRNERRRRKREEGLRS